MSNDLSSSSAALAPASGSPPDVAAMQARIDRMNREGVALMQEKATLAAQYAQLEANYAKAAADSKGLRPPPVPLFHGAMGYGIDSWVREMKENLDANPAVYAPNDHSLRVSTAARYLKDAAAEWWSQQDKLAITTWDEFVSRLFDRFRPMQAAEIARHRLKQLRQTHSVSAYCNVFQKELGPLKNMAVDEQLFWFKEGLDARIRTEILKLEPKTLHAAMDAAVKAEAYLGHVRNHGASTGARPGFAQPYSRGPSSSNHAPMDVNMVAQDLGTDNGEFVSYGLPTHAEETSVAPPGPSSSRDTTALMLQRMESMEKMFVASMQSFRPASGRPNAYGGPRRDQDRVSGLKPGDIDRLRREGRCFRCQEKGHMKNECPKKASKE